MNQRIRFALLALGTVMLLVRFNYSHNDRHAIDFAHLANPSSPSMLLRSGPARHLTAAAPQEIGIIHVGKCGGVGLRHSLEHPQTQSILKQKQVHWIHMESVGDSHRYNPWIVLVRDPIARIQSNYIYEHVANAHLRTDAVAAVPQSRLPNKAKLYECYNTLEKLVSIGLAPIPPPPDRIADHAIPGKAAPGSDDCRRLAFGLFDGPAQHLIPGMPHFSYNYEFYTKELLMEQRDDPEIKIWLVRQEHMKEDVDTIDRALGGDGVVWHMDQFEHVNVAAAKKMLEESPERKQQMSKEVSPAGLRNLCRVLCKEIQIYKALIGRAQQNFIDGAEGSNAFVEETLAPLKEQCPKEVQSSACEPVMPSSLKASNKAASSREYMATVQ